MVRRRQSGTDTATTHVDDVLRRLLQDSATRGHTKGTLRENRGRRDVHCRVSSDGAEKDLAVFF